MKPYYEHAGVTIYHGDCRELLPAVDADSCITDPPYDSATHDGALGDGGRSKLVTFEPVTADYLAETFALLRVRRWIVSSVDWKHMSRLSAPIPGIRFVRFGVWVKSNGAPQFTGDRPGQGWEAIAILHREGETMRWNGGGRHGVWQVARVNGEHPTAKPPRLVSDFVRLFTDEGETVLDPFMGSGTTLRAAKDLGRRAIGIEIEGALLRDRRAPSRAGSPTPGRCRMTRPQLYRGAGAWPVLSPSEPPAGHFFERDGPAGGAFQGAML